MQSLHEIVPWLKDNAGLLSAVVTALAAVGAALGWVIKLVIRSRERKARCRPILDFREQIVDKP